MVQFANLHLHTEYSALDGIIKIAELMPRLKELGQTHVAITDHGTLAAMPSAYKHAKQNGIHLIPGFEAYTVPDRNVVIPRKKKKTEGEAKKSNFHLVLLARNRQGYSNLLKLHFEGYQHRVLSAYGRVIPRIDYELLEKYGKGIIGLSACLAGEIPVLLRDKKYDEAEKIAKFYSGVFDKFYLEVQPTYKIDQDGGTAQADANREVVRLAQKLSIPTVVTTDSHYLKADDEEVHELALAVQSKKAVKEEGVFFFRSTPVLGAHELRSEFEEEVINRTVEVAGLCDPCDYLDPGKSYKMPVFSVPKEPKFEEWCQDKRVQEKYGDEDVQTKYFRYRVQLGWNKKVNGVIKGEQLEVYKERLKEELRVIVKMKFPSYFLIVMDMLDWCDANGIRRGVGRGSAGGCLIAYLLDIVKTNPIKHGLLFSRFLNEDRISMPDIDSDIDKSQRERVKQYLKDTYGEDKVASIGTFGTMKVRACIKDIVRSLKLGGDKGATFRLAEQISSTIPADPPDITFKAALEESEAFRNLVYYPTAEEYEKDNWKQRIANNEFPSKYWQVGRHLRRIENVIRQTGTHAAGVIISTEPLNQIMPMAIDKNGIVITAYDMRAIEDAGFLKLDVLGLETLTKIDRTIKIIKKLRNEDVKFALNGLPLIQQESEADFNARLTTVPLSVQRASKAYRLLRSGKTNAVFQLESPGMSALLKSIQVNSVDDVSVVLALHRPGPLESGLTAEYAERKFGRKPIEHLHPSLEPVLRATYGIAAFQEDVMRIAVQCAGFTMPEADTLRKYIGKKIKDKMLEYGSKFIKGCEKTVKMPHEVAEKLWQQIVGWMGYGFNASHSLCYAMTAYQTAYLKANYPAEFWGPVLSLEPDQEKLGTFLSEVQSSGIKVLPVDINKSGLDFEVESTGSIRRGLTSLKGVGNAAVREIIAKRPFASMNDFLVRVSSRRVNSGTVKVLIQAGAFLNTFEKNYSRKAYHEQFEQCRGELKKLGDKAFKEFLKKIGCKSSDFKTIPQTLPFNVSGDTWEEKAEKAVDIVKSQASKDYKFNWQEMDEWTLEEILAKETEIYGSPVSGHIFDMYKQYEEQVYERFGKAGHVCYTNSQLDKWGPDATAVMMVRIVRLIKKYPYKNDATQFIRFFEIEDRGGKREIGVFEKNYSDMMINDEGKRIRVWQVGNIIIMKINIQEYKGRKDIKYKSCMKVL